jgi:hypothetical protein
MKGGEESVLGVPSLKGWRRSAKRIIRKEKNMYRERERGRKNGMDV